VTVFLVILPLPFIILEVAFPQSFPQNVLSKRPNYNPATRIIKVIQGVFDWLIRRDNEGFTRRERNIIEAAQKRSPVAVSVSAWRPGLLGIYVNDVLADWEPGFLAARSKALETIDFLENRGFQVRAPGLRSEPSVRRVD
jgi:hypothetical protein